MQHRHLNHQRYTPAVIDDVITRGQWQDWVDLRQAVLTEDSVSDRVERVCRPYLADPYAQRHHFWMYYVGAHRNTAQLG